MGDGGVYVIRAAGCLHGDWAQWFDARVTISGTENTTTIIARLPDQAALYGLLAKVRDIGMVLLSVHRCNDRDWPA